MRLFEPYDTMGVLSKLTFEVARQLLKVNMLKHILKGKNIYRLKYSWVLQHKHFLGSLLLTSQQVATTG